MDNLRFCIRVFLFDLSGYCWTDQMPLVEAAIISWMWYNLSVTMFDWWFTTFDWFSSPLTEQLFEIVFVLIQS